jgi:hypothetical protein
MKDKPEDEIFERQAALLSQGRLKKGLYDRMDTAPEFRSREVERGTGFMAGAQTNVGNFFIQNEDLSSDVITYSLTDANRLI